MLDKIYVSALLVRLLVTIILLTIQFSSSFGQINMHRGFDQLFVLPLSIDVIKDTIKTYSIAGVPFSGNVVTTRPYVSTFDTTGSVIDSFYTANLNEHQRPVKAIFDKNGDMLLAGVFFQDSLGNDIKPGVYLQKWQNGQKVWTRKFRDTLPYIEYIINDMVQTESGLIAMVGYLGLEGDSIQPGNDGFPDADILFILCDSNGTALEFKRLGNNNAQEIAVEIEFGSDSTFIISSTRRLTSGSFRRLIITDYFGNVQKMHVAQGARVLSATETRDKGYAFTSFTGNSTGLKATIHKLDSNMNPIWTTVFERVFLNNHNAMKKIKEDSNGNLYVMGNQYGVLFDQDTSGRYGFLVKLSPNGDSLWGKYYGIIDYSTFKDVQSFSDFVFYKDKIYIAGYVESLTGNLNPAQQLWLVSVDTNGCPHPDCVVGIDEPSDLNQDISIIPNPNKGEFKFRFKEGMIEPQELRIYDSNGIEILYDQNFDFGNEINLNGVRDGIYFYSIQGVDTVGRGKFVIQN